jgi:hypothetical protein
MNSTKRYKLVWKYDRNCVTIISEKRMKELCSSFIRQQFEVKEI